MEFELIKIIDSVLYFTLIIITYCFIKKTFARSNIFYLFFAVSIMGVAANYFSLSLVLTLCEALIIGMVVSVVISNEQKINKMLKRKKTNKETSNISEERKQLYKIINDTVAMLSTSKTGAIMTFEKHNSLNDYINKGIKINAPISKELLTTIFYEGTTLHDGAVIIRGNMIMAASVYYIPTVRAMNGKYGARHRASLGISEVCDALTVVVSEETGRISLAIDGELQAVTRENFLQTFKRELEK